MKVENLLVEEISLDKSNKIAYINSTMFNFNKPQWVSSHKERKGKQLGPFTLLTKPDKDDEFQKVSILPFGKRQLYINETRKFNISFKDIWTIPPWTIYALVLPKDFTATHIKLEHQEGSGYEPKFTLGTSRDNKLFHFCVFGHAKNKHIFNVEAKINENQKHYQKLIESSEAVNGTRNYDHLRKTVERELASSDFWFKLLEFGGKLLGNS